MRGDGRVFRRGQIWWVAYYFDGQECRESSQSRDRKDAVRLLRRVGEAAAGIAPHPIVPRTSGERTLMMNDLSDLTMEGGTMGQVLHGCATTTHAVGKAIQ